MARSCRGCGSALIAGESRRRGLCGMCERDLRALMKRTAEPFLKNLLDALDAEALEAAERIRVGRVR